MPVAKQAVWLAQLGQLLLVLAAWLKKKRVRLGYDKPSLGYIGDEQLSSYFWDYHQPWLGGNSNIFGLFIPIYGSGSILNFDDHIFQMGWFNHQLENVFFLIGFGDSGDSLSGLKMVLRTFHHFSIQPISLQSMFPWKHLRRTNNKHQKAHQKVFLPVFFLRKHISADLQTWFRWCSFLEVNPDEQHHSFWVGRFFF